MHCTDFCGFATVLVRPQLHTNLISTVIWQNRDSLGRRTYIGSNNTACWDFNQPMNNERCSRLNMWHVARTSYDRHCWAVQCISNATIAEDGELWDKSEHVYTVSQCTSSQTAPDYSFAKTWATIKLESTVSCAKQWPHPTDTAHYLAKVYIQNSHRTSGN